MDRQRISAVAHTDHPIAGPLADATVRALLDRAAPRGDERLLDLGCAEGVWLVRALTGRAGLRAVGVDIDAERIARGREAAAAAGLGDRLVLQAGNAAGFTAPHPFDLVLCVGSTHAFGGLLPALEAARGHLAPGGHVLVGDGFWEREPGPAALDALGAVPGDYDDLATTVDRVAAEGWTPVSGHVSTPEEWDDYEWSWTGSLARWALDHPEHPDRGTAATAAADHRRGWLHGYRGTLGFVTLLLRRTAPDGTPGPRPGGVPS